MLATLERIEGHLARLDRYVVGAIRWQRIRTALAVVVQVFWIAVFLFAAWQVKMWTENATASINKLLERPAFMQDASDTLQGWRDSAGSLSDDLFGTPPSVTQ